MNGNKIDTQDVDFSGSTGWNANGILKGDGTFGLDLFDSTGIISINYDTRLLYDNTVTRSVGWQARKAYNSVDSETIDWEGTILRDAGSLSTSIDWVNRVLNDSFSVLSISYENRELVDDAGLVSIGWQQRKVYDNAGGQAVSWQGRVLYDSGAVITLNWNTKNLIGDWAAQDNFEVGDTLQIDQQLICSKGIDTTAGDSATLNVIVGRFRKDVTGATFTLTNSLITASSIILLTFASDPGIATQLLAVAGAGSAVITFLTVPLANTDVNFIVIN